MKNKLTIKKIFSYDVLLTALAFSMPIHRISTSIITALLFIKWLSEINKSSFISSWKKLFVNPIFFLFVFFILHLIGLSYTSHFQNGLSELETKLSLFLFPIVFLFRSPKSQLKLNYTWIFNALITGLILKSVFSLGVSYGDYSDGKANAFYYSSLGKDFHPSYFSLYLNLSLSYLIIRYFKTPDQKPFEQVTSLIIFTFLAIMIILLSSKAGILGLLINILIGLFFIIKSKLRVKDRLLFLSSFIILLVFILTFPYSIERFIGARNAMTNSSTNEDKTESTASRITIWRNSIQAIKAEPIWGYGTGSVKEVLHEIEVENDHIISDQRYYDAHNQFLQTYLVVGIPGIMIFLTFFFLSIKQAIMRQKLILGIFLGLIILNLMFESMLDRQLGISFIIFFLVILIYQPKREMIQSVRL
ncbi:MAG: O-antigen ligase family protein [Bacteroidales bacterium]|nr:O-antigen ligase family protein [Bacteroidales bacterium]